MDIRLAGHGDNTVVAVAVSHDGRWLASGEKADAMSRATICLWDLKAIIASAGTTQTAIRPVSRLSQHHGAIQALAFNADASLLASIGGADDNVLIVWDVVRAKALTAQPAARQATQVVAWYNNNPSSGRCLVTAGVNHARQWSLNLSRGTCVPEELQVGSIKRGFSAIAIDASDQRLFLGSKSGDVMSFNLANSQMAGNSSERFPQGVNYLLMVQSQPFTAEGSPAVAYTTSKPPPPASSVLLVGTGDGALARLRPETLEREGPLTSVEGGVTSLSLLPSSSEGDVSVTTTSSRSSSGIRGGSIRNDRVLVGTAGGNTYEVAIKSMTATLTGTSHPGPVVDAVFPSGSSDLVLTASGSEIRLWNTASATELLRITVPNVEVHCVDITRDGSRIVSGWSDGRVRIFLPQSGKLAQVINDAHPDSVTALCLSADAKSVVTGGKDGRVRLWSLSGPTPVMMHNFREHREAITSVAISVDGERALSSSVDGSCVVWNLRRGSRHNALFASTIFRQIKYAPGEGQLVTVGSDRRIGFYDADSCSCLRSLEGSEAEVRADTVDAWCRHNLVLLLTSPIVLSFPLVHACTRTPLCSSRAWTSTAQAPGLPPAGWTRRWRCGPMRRRGRVPSRHGSCTRGTRGASTRWSSATMGGDWSAWVRRAACSSGGWGRRQWRCRASINTPL